MSRDVFHVFGTDSGLVHVTDTNCLSRHGSTHSPVGAAFKLGSLKKHDENQSENLLSLSLSLSLLFLTYNVEGLSTILQQSVRSLILAYDFVLPTNFFD